MKIIQAPTYKLGEFIKPQFIIVHYTATGSLESALFTLQKSKRRVSCHFIVDRNGDIYQLAPVDRETWHAGRSSWCGLNGLNKHSIGIEFVNAGYLTNGKTWYGEKLSPQEIYTHSDGSQWQDYPSSQILGFGKLREHLRALEVLGHEHVSPGRKIDPGPAFWRLIEESPDMDR